MSVSFINDGLIDLRSVTVFGVCVKPGDNPIGYFGTGLKYAIAVLLRAGCIVELNRGDENFVFTVNIEEFRGEGISRVYMNGEPLPFTTELGKNWEPWMAYRELASNAFDEGGAVSDTELSDYANKTGWVIEGKAIEQARDEHNQIFLQTEPLHKLKGVDLHDDLDGGGWIYHRGIRVMKLKKRALYNYNLMGKVRLTEDRTLSSLSDAHIAIAKGLVASDQPSLIRQLLLANHQFFESTIDYNWWTVKPGKTFNKVVERFGYAGTSYNSSAKDVYKRDHPKEKPPATVQLETIPMEHRRKLWAALRFWGLLGIEIPRSVIRVTEELGKSRGKAISGQIYLSAHVLEFDMRHVSGAIYKLYSQTKPDIEGVKQEDLLLDTIVDFGERLLGVAKQRKSA